jgi:hypothetical protein
MFINQNLRLIGGGGGGGGGPAGQIQDPVKYQMNIMREQMAIQRKLQIEQEQRMRENARLDRIEAERAQEEAARRRGSVVAEEQKQQAAVFLETTGQATAGKGEMGLGEAGLNLEMPTIERPAYETEIRPL